MIDTRPFKVITIHGVPVSKLRPRVTKSGRAYTPTKTRDWERMASKVISLEWRGLPVIDRPITLGVTAIYPRPKSRPKQVQPEWWKTGLRIWRPCRPDLDNVVKAAMDATEKSGVLADDCLVVELFGKKLWAGKNDPGPMVILSFSEVIQ